MEDLYKNYLNIQIKSTKDFSDDKLALEYSQFQRNLNPVLNNINNKKGKILEIGFGSGYLLQFLTKLHSFKKVFGVEVSKTTYNFVKKNIYKNVFYKKNTNTFIKSKSPWDMIIMLDVLEHIPKKETIPMLKVIRESLSKKGVFIARVPNSANPLNQNVFADFTHEFFYNKKSFSQVLETAGFTNYKVLAWKEEDISAHSKITNITAPIMYFFIKIIAHLSRSSFYSDSLLSRDIFCIAYKDENKL